jgi:hypothetical protein
VGRGKRTWEQQEREREREGEEGGGDRAKGSAKSLISRSVWHGASFAGARGVGSAGPAPAHRRLVLCHRSVTPRPVTRPPFIYGESFRHSSPGHYSARQPEALGQLAMTMERHQFLLLPLPRRRSANVLGCHSSSPVRGVGARAAGVAVALGAAPGHLGAGLQPRRQHARRRRTGD